MYEFLKKLFGTGEDGKPVAMTYEQLEEAIKADKNLNIVNLADGGYVSKDKLDAKITELSGVKQQLTDANAEIQSYKDMDIDGIKQKAADWEAKYNTDTQALNDKLAEQEISHQTDMFFKNYKFSSTPAMNGIRAEFEKKGFKLEDGKFLGAEDYMKSLMENEDYKGAFVSEQEPPAEPTPETPPLPPTFAGPTGGPTPGGKNAFNFGFAGVRPREK